MNRLLLRPAISITVLFSILQFSAAQYKNYSSMAETIAALGNKFPSLCSVKSISKTAGGKEIWVISLGSGNRDNKPGIAIFGGVEGNYLLGRELALGFATSILNDNSESARALLEKVSFYVFPDVSPDASEQYFSKLKYERNINAGPTDDDRDFKDGEDPFDDLNNDGLITLMRIPDPSGEYVILEDDARIMTLADITKGQKGNFQVYSEGIDNDNDGKFNEDSEGGVNFNRNFTYNYEEFGINAGVNAVSEPETKAVADFLFDRFNIFAVFAYGPQDNLGQPFKYLSQTNTDRRIISIMKSDEPINKLVSDRFQEITCLRGAPSSKLSPGNFLEWAYYHYGRYSFGTPGWWYPVEKGRNADAEFLKYAEKNNIKDVFVPWQKINHPGFPGKLVEVGGIKPYVMINPPADSLEALTKKNYHFISEIAMMHPELEFLDFKTENAGNDVFRISLKIHNKGIFATVAEIGELNTWTRIMRISLEPANGQTIVSGTKVQRIKRLEGNQTAEFAWLIKGKGTLKIIAGAVNTGIITATTELK